MTLASVEIPQTLGAQEILLEVHVVAQNPIDSKVRRPCSAHDSGSGGLTVAALAR